MRSTQAATSAIEALEVSKNRLRSASDFFALPSAKFKTADAMAEGNGKRSSQAERRRFFEMAMGSISEVAACLDLAFAFRLIGRAELDDYKSRLRLAYVRIGALP